MSTNTILGRSVTTGSITKEMYDHLLAAKQKSNFDKESLRSAIIDALDLLGEDDSAAQAILEAALEATKLVVIKPEDEDCGCGGK